MNAAVTVLAALGGISFIGTAINAFAQRRAVRAAERKTGADAAAILTETATELVEPLRRELKATREEFAETRAELAGAREEIAALRGHLAIVEGLLRDREITIPEFVWPPINGRH